MPHTHIAIIYDNSGSMYSCYDNFTPLIPSLPECMDSLAESLKPHGITSSFHVFSDDVKNGDNLQAILLKATPKGTNIGIGFLEMTRSFKHGADHVVIIFVSDGKDSTPSEGMLMRALLPMLRETSTLLTIAVGANFPTTTVLNDLYGKFHTSPDKSLPLVFPVDPRADNTKQVVQLIQAQLTDVILEIASGVPRKQVTVADLEEMDKQAIYDQCVRWYNECSVKCLLQGPLPEKISSVEECKAKLNAAHVFMRKGLTAESLKPLASNIKKNAALHHLTGIREKLNTILAQLNKGRLFEHLTDQEKSQFLSFASNKIGAYSSKAVKYHGADMKKAVESLKDKIRSYTATEFDKQVVETFFFCSQAEIWEDARANQELFEKISCMAEAIEQLPQSGRAVECLPIPECAQMNPWLITISGMPTVIKIITTHDLYCTAKGELNYSDQKTNNIMILGGDKDRMEVETYVQTFTVCGWMCYHKDARLAMVGAVLNYLLKGDLQQWKLEELAWLRAILDLHTPSNSRWWHEYCAMLETDPRKCLVTESVDLPSSIRCQGLNKPILALWRAIDGGKQYDAAALRDIMLAFVTEFLGRCKVDRVNLKQQLTMAYKLPECSTDAMCAEVISKVSLQHISMPTIVHTLEAGISKMLKDAKGEVTVAVDTGSLNKLQHFNLTLPQINTIFLNLSKMCKIEKWQSITDDELIRALFIASSNFGSLGRNSPSEAQLTSPIQEIKQAIAASLAANVKAEHKAALFASSKQRIASHLHAQHIGLPKAIPSEFVSRYYAETGRDIAKDYAVNPKTNLSSVACCYPSCELYLTIPAGNEQQQRSILKAHLHDCSKTVIPGLHECVALNVGKSASEIVTMIKEGKGLKAPFPSRSFGKQKFDKKQVQLLERRQHRQLNAAINSYEGGDSNQLYHLIWRMQEGLTVQGSYEAFKEAFDRKYA